MTTPTSEREPEAIAQLRQISSIESPLAYIAPDILAAYDAVREQRDAAVTKLAETQRYHEERGRELKRLLDDAEAARDAAKRELEQEKEACVEWQEESAAWSRECLNAREERDELRAKLAAAEAVNVLAKAVAFARYDAQFFPALKALTRALTPPAPKCDHQLVDTRNSVVLSGEMCVKCGAIRAGNVTTDTLATGTTEGVNDGCR